MSQTPAQKAAATRRARRERDKGTRAPVVAEQDGGLLDLSLPKSATKHAVRRSLEGLARLLKEAASAPVRRKPLLPVTSGEESIVVLLSDLHFGKSIPNPYKRGEYSFNVAIGIGRMTKILSEVVELSVQREADEIIVLLGGDLIDGEGIYPTQASHLEQTVIEQVYGTAKGMFAWLRQMHEETGLPIRVLAAPGNHGRVSRYSDELTNWDQAIAIMLGLMADLVDDPIDVTYPETREFIVGNIKGHNVLLRHKAKRGTSPAPRSQWQNWILQHDFKIAATGHWHQPGLEFVMDRAVFRNGSLCGVDDFGESLGYGDAASQWIWGMSESDPLTFSRLVRFEDGKE